MVMWSSIDGRGSQRDIGVRTRELRHCGGVIDDDDECGYDWIVECDDRGSECVEMGREPWSTDGRDGIGGERVGIGQQREIESIMGRCCVP